MIGWALDHRKTVLVSSRWPSSSASPPSAAWRNRFFPSQDQGEFQINFQTAPDASIEETEGRVRAVLAMLGKISRGQAHLRHYRRRRCGNGPGRQGLCEAFGQGRARPSQQEIQQDVRKRLQDIPGIIPAIVEIGRPTGEKPLVVSIRGEDVKLLKKYAVS